MLALILMLFQAAAPAAPAPSSGAAPPNTVSGVTVEAAPQAKGKPPPHDVFVDVGSNDQDIGQKVIIWPAAAYTGRYDGRVVMNCEIDPHGLAETCVVTYETPPGHGFAAAALAMRPTFKFDPALDANGQPTSVAKSIAVTFKAPRNNADLEALRKNDGGGTSGGPNRGTVFEMDQVTFASDNPLKMTGVTMVDRPIWAQAASFDDLALAYPARGGGAEGYTVAHCQVVQATGALTKCQIVKATPDKRDFDKAALALTAKFRISPQVLAKAPPGAGLWVDVPIRLPSPDQLKDRTVRAPVWLASFDPASTRRFFPRDAVAQGVTSGQGVARCTVTAEGTLSDCVPEPGDPDGMGFSEAAAKLAAVMRMNLWSSDAAPVAGGVVHVPVRLDLKRGD